MQLLSFIVYYSLFIIHCFPPRVAGAEHSAPAREAVGMVALRQAS
jgi:hypothetical protein